MQPPNINHTLIADLEILGFFFFFQLMLFLQFSPKILFQARKSYMSMFEIRIFFSNNIQVYLVHFSNQGSSTWRPIG